MTAAAAAAAAWLSVCWTLVLAAPVIRHSSAGAVDADQFSQVLAILPVDDSSVAPSDLDVARPTTTTTTPTTTPSAAIRAGFELTSVVGDSLPNASQFPFPWFFLSKLVSLFIRLVNGLEEKHEITSIYI